MARAATSRKRKTLIILGAVVLALVLLIALLPMMISAGLGHGMIRSAIAQNINGTADFQSLRVTWLGPQRMSGLRIVDDRGDEAAMLDAQLEQGLASLLLGSRIDATVSGTVRGELYEDGTVSFQRLVRDDQPQPDEPFNLEGVPATTLTLDGVTAQLLDVAGGQTIRMADIRGMLVYEPGSELNFDLRSADEAGNGSVLTAAGAAPGLFASDGRFSPEGSPMNVELTVRNIPVPGVEVSSVLHELTLTAATEDISRNLALNLAGSATVQQEQPSRFHGEFRIRQPIRADGTIDIALERIEGGLTGEQVPSSLLQPFFNDTPVVLSRDIGATVDVDVQLNSGTEGPTVVRAVGERGSVDLSAVQRERDQWWIGDQLHIVTPAAHPDLVHGFTGLTLAQSTYLEIQLQSFVIPAVDEQLDARPWALAGATGSLQVQGPAEILFQQPEQTDGAQQRRVTLANAVINLDSASLGEMIYANGRAQVDGGDVAFEYAIANLGDGAGRIEPANAQPIGTLTVTNLPADSAAQWMPEQEQLISALLGATVNVSMQTEMVEQGLRAQLAASGESAELTTTALRTDAALRFDQTRARLDLTPDLAQTLLEDLMDEPVRITESARVNVELDPFEFPGQAPFDYEFGAVPIVGRLTMDNLVLDRVPGIEEAVRIADLAAAVNARFDEPWRVAVQGDASLHRATGNRPVGSLQYDLAASPRDDQPVSVSGTLAVLNLQVENAEAMLGQDTGTLSDWVGRSGTVRAELATIDARYEANLTTEMERLQGTFAASLEDDLLRLNTIEDASMTMAAAALRRMLEGDDAAVDVQVLDDIPLTLALAAQLPLAMFQGEAYEQTLVELDAQLTGGPVVVQSEGERSTLDNVLISLQSEPTAEGVDFLVTVDADILQSAETAQAGEIDLTARLRDMLAGNADGLINYDTLHLDLDGTVVRAPSILADALLGMRGYLVTAVGRELDATIISRDFSRESGELSIDIDGPYGWLRAAGQGYNNGLVFADGSPVEAELEITPLLSELLLRNVHPLLGDIITAHQPLRATLSNAMIPMDGDVSRLNGDVTLNIGEVDLDAQSPLFALLRAARVVDVPALSGFIPTITAQIRNGIVQYEQFVVTIDRLDIPYQGTIDLNENRVQLRTSLPLGELLLSGVREVPEQARMIMVPIVTSGSTTQLSTQVDPQFDLARALIDAGVRQGLQDLLPRDRLPFDIRDILPRR